MMPAMLKINLYKGTNCKLTSTILGQELREQKLWAKSGTHADTYTEVFKALLRNSNLKI